MKRIISVSVLTLQLSFGQVSSSSVTIANRAATTTKLPQYLVYRHFLGWVATLEKRANASASTDPYKFAEPFARHAGLGNSHLDLLGKEAKSLQTDLDQQDQKAAHIIKTYRAEAKSAAQLGSPLPALPSALYELQQVRTALLVQHYVKFKAGLGPDAAARLDNYLAREFVPHMSMNYLQLPKPASGGGASPPPFSGPLY